MKKIFILLVTLSIYSNTAVANEKFKFKYHIDDSLSKKWVTEFENTMNIVQEVLPIQDNMYDYLNTPEMPIYAWKNTNKNPFPKIKKNLKGSCICGDGTTRWMQLGIQKQDITKKRNRVYSVIVHEYFHIYQIALSENKLSDRNSPKWLIEGGAKVLQEIYARQYYGKNFLKSDIQDRERWSIKKISKKPHLFEKHKTSPTKNGFDSNYAGSAFIVLALVNELKKNNISEQEAFELVFREIWVQRSKYSYGSGGWKYAFEKSFGMTVEDFYEKLSKYKRKDLKNILPSKTLKIQDIFS